MELRLRDKEKFVDKGFGNWLVQRIRIKLLSEISKYNLTNWDKYLSESANLNRLYARDYKASEILVFAANNLACTGIDGDISIQFDNTKFVPGFDRLKLDLILRTITFGTRDTKACPIITDVFNSFAEDIDTYLHSYYML